MDSEIESLPVPLTTQDSVKTGSKKSKRGKSAHITWAYTRTACDREDSRLKFCIHCTGTSPYSTAVSTNMRIHLESKYGIIVDRTPGPIQAETVRQLQQLYTRAQSLGQTEEIDTQVYRKHLNQDIIDKALITLIIVQNLPFRVIK